MAVTPVAVEIPQQLVLNRPPEAVAAQPVGPNTAQALNQQNALANQGRNTLQGNQQLGQEWQQLAGNQPGRQDGIPGGTLISALKPEELESVFGGASQTITGLAEKRPEMTLNQALPLASNPEALDTVSQLLDSRPDLQLSDVISQGQGGRPQLSPMLKDPQAMELLKNRSDIQPGALDALAKGLNKMMGNPAMGKAAFAQAMEMMANDGNATPESIGELMGEIVKGVGGKGDAANALGIFKQAGELMKGGQLKSEDMLGLVKAASNIGGGKGGGSMMAEAFDAAANLKLSRPDMNTNEIVGLSSVMAERFPGQNNADRMSAFREGANLMNTRPNLGAQGVDTMLSQATRQGIKGDKLLNAFQTQVGALNEGSASLQTLTDPLSKPDAKGGVQFNRFGQRQAGTRPEEVAQREQQQANRNGQPGQQQPGQTRPGQPQAGQAAQGEQETEPPAAGRSRGRASLASVGVTAAPAAAPGVA
ncbi:MAG: hypothetical protein AB7S38_39155 [Vulcanimicrobiota bacterium]